MAASTIQAVQRPAEMEDAVLWSDSDNDSENIDSLGCCPCLETARIAVSNANRLLEECRTKEYELKNSAAISSATRRSAPRKIVRLLRTARAKLRSAYSAIQQISSASGSDTESSKNVLIFDMSELMAKLCHIETRYVTEDEFRNATRAKLTAQLGAMKVELANCFTKEERDLVVSCLGILEHKLEAKHHPGKEGGRGKQDLMVQKAEEGADSLKRPATPEKQMALGPPETPRAPKKTRMSRRAREYTQAPPRGSFGGARDATVKIMMARPVDLSKLIAEEGEEEENTKEGKDVNTLIYELKKELRGFKDFFSNTASAPNIWKLYRILRAPPMERLAKYWKTEAPNGGNFYTQEYLRELKEKSSREFRKVVRNVEAAYSTVRNSLKIDPLPDTSPPASKDTFKGADGFLKWFRFYEEFFAVINNWLYLIELIVPLLAAAGGDVDPVDFDRYFMVHKPSQEKRGDPWTGENPEIVECLEMGVDEEAAWQVSLRDMPPLDAKIQPYISPPKIPQEAWKDMSEKRVEAFRTASQKVGWLRDTLSSKSPVVTMTSHEKVALWKISDQGMPFRDHLNLSDMMKEACHGDPPKLSDAPGETPADKMVEIYNWLNNMWPIEQFHKETAKHQRDFQKLQRRLLRLERLDILRVRAIANWASRNPLTVAADERHDSKFGRWFNQWKLNFPPGNVAFDSFLMLVCFAEAVVCYRDDLQRADEIRLAQMPPIRDMGTALDSYWKRGQMTLQSAEFDGVDKMMDGRLESLSDMNQSQNQSPAPLTAAAAAMAKRARVMPAYYMAPEDHYFHRSIDSGASLPQQTLGQWYPSPPSSPSIQPPQQHRAFLDPSVELTERLNSGVKRGWHEISYDDDRGCSPMTPPESPEQGRKSLDSPSEIDLGLASPPPTKRVRFQEEEMPPAHGTGNINANPREYVVKRSSMRRTSRAPSQRRRRRVRGSSVSGKRTADSQPRSHSGIWPAVPPSRRRMDMAAGTKGKRGKSPWMGSRKLTWTSDDEEAAKEKKVMGEMAAGSQYWNWGSMFPKWWN